MEIPRSEPRVLLQSDTLHIGSFGQGKTPYPEDIAVGGVLRAIAQHLQVDLKTGGVFWGDYCYFAGVTGEAFRFLDLVNLGKPNAPKVPALVTQYGQLTVERMFREALDSAGLASEIHLRPEMPDKNVLQWRIVQSLQDRQTPVIGIGAFGPPEPFLITGFDRSGEVLAGWAHFTDERKGDPNLGSEPTGEFRLANWYDALDGAVFVTGKKQHPPLKEIYAAAIRRGTVELRATRFGGFRLGTAAIEDWASYLESDPTFASLSAEQLKKAHSDHSTAAGDLAERRALAGSFMELAARVFPQVKGNLDGAQAAFQGAHDTVYEIWETVANTGPFDPDLAKFKDPERRKTMAGLVRRLAEFDRRGASYLDLAINSIDGKPAGEPIAPDPQLDGTVVLKKAPTVVPPPSTNWAPENVAVPNAMGMLRQFLGEPFGELNDAEKASGKLDYVLWMGFSGAAFGLLHDGPDRSDLPLVFDALGYDYEIWASGKRIGETGLAAKNWGWDDNLRRRIFWNLRDRRLPVLVFDCGKWPDWYLVTRAEHWWAFSGYGGSNGEGYRPNDPLDHPSNPLKSLDLMEAMKGKNTWTVNVLAKRTAPKPAMDDLYQRAVERGATRMQQQKMKLLTADGKEFISDRPYQDWAAMMRSDALFPADRPEVLNDRREGLSGDEVELAERRFYGAMFLDLAAARLKRPELHQAADHFRKVTGIVDQIWKQMGGMNAPEAHLRLGDKQTRETIADLLLQIGREEAVAADLLGRERR